MIFAHNEAQMLGNEEIGAQVYKLYSDVADYHYLFDRVRSDMEANRKVIDKNKKIFANLQSQMEGVDMDF